MYKWQQWGIGKHSFKKLPARPLSYSQRSRNGFLEIFSQTISQQFHW